MSDEDADTETSGNHVNDALNQCDASGRVLVNIGHPANEPDIFLAPQIAAAVKPHQVRCSFWLIDMSLSAFRRQLLKTFSIFKHEYLETQHIGVGLIKPDSMSVHKSVFPSVHMPLKVLVSVKFGM